MLVPLPLLSIFLTSLVTAFRSAPALRAIGTHMPEHQHIPVERVGTFEFEVLPAERTPESEARWNDRTQALADLLLVLWEQEQRQEAQAA